MRTVVRAPRRLLRVALIAAALFGAVSAASDLGGLSVAHADDDAPVKAGTTLVARGDCELQKVVITRGAKVEVTSSSSTTADIALPDGAVLKRIPMTRIRYFFDVVR